MEYDNARVLITDQKLESIKDVMGIMEVASKAGMPLVIIAEDVTVRDFRVEGNTACECLWWESTRNGQPPSLC